MKKVLLIILIVILVIAFFVILSAFIASGFDFSKIGKPRYETHTYSAESDFRNIVINSNVDNIEIMPSSDGKCSIECMEPEKVTHTVVIENNTLKIDVKDERIWIDFIALFSKSPEMTVYLPSEYYDSISVQCNTGNIIIPNAFSFRTISVSGNTGNILCSSSASESVTISTTTGNMTVVGIKTNVINLTSTTGNIKASTIECSGDATVKVTTGNAGLFEFKCGSLKLTGTTGHLTLSSVVATGNFNIEGSTGSVQFEKSDAANIYVKTSTGSVSGSLLSDKDFRAKSTTGRVQVPDTKSGGICEVVSTTGSISITVAD